MLQHLPLSISWACFVFVKPNLAWRLIPLILEGGCHYSPAEEGKALTCMSSVSLLFFCFQETHLKESHSNVLRNFKVFRQDRLNSLLASRAGVVVQRVVPSTEVALQTSLQAEAVLMLLDAWLLSAQCTPLRDQLQYEELDYLIFQLPVPCMILFDFNAHNLCGKAVERTLEGLSCNGFFFTRDYTREATYFSTASCSFTSIDLSVCHPSLYPLFSGRSSQIQMRGTTFHSF